MNRISVMTVAGVIGAVGLTAGCSSGASKSPSAAGSLSSTTTIGSSSSSQSGSESSTTAPASPSSATPSMSTSASTSTPSATGTHAAGIKCTAAEMPAGTWKVVEGSNGAGHVAADISLRNTSTHPCTVSGYPAVSMLASDQHPLPTNVVHFPATAPTLTVAPGAWIHSEVRYSPDIPGPGEPTTGNCEPETVHALAQLPGDTKWVPVTLSMPTPVCEKGTLQAKPFASGESSPTGG